MTETRVLLFVVPCKLQPSFDVLHVLKRRVFFFVLVLVTHLYVGALVRTRTSGALLELLP